MADRRCPVHAEADADVMDAWPCPDDCEHFLAELARRIADVEAGNYFRMVVDLAGTQATPDDMEAGRYMWQEYRNHQPYGPPRPRGRRSDG